MSKIYIGIDPDLVKSGWALWQQSSKVFGVQLKTMLEVIAYLNNISTGSNKESYTIIIEAGWLNKKSNFRNNENKATGEAIARKVGENHAVGKIIAQVCAELQIPYKLVKPTQSKVNPAYFEKLTGLKVKNQEMIDAGMLVWGI